MLQQIFKSIQNNNGRAYLVGGYVRDFILSNGKSLEDESFKDIDIEVFGLSYDELIKILSEFGKVDLVGKSFGVIKLTTKSGIDYDFNLPRRDSKNGIGHKGFTVVVDHTMTIEEAAARRDFTINSISIDVNGNIIDPYNGKFDIENRVLKPTSEAFKEDSLRVLRGFQFSARFNMNPSVGCCMDSVEMKVDYNNLPKERVWTEWEKWASKGKHYSTSLRYLKNVYWSSLYPELHAIYDVKQDFQFHPEGTVDIHTGFVLDHMAEICERENIIGEDRLVLIFAALCHDFGKATTTKLEFKAKYNREVITANGHEAAGGPLTRSFLESIGCPEKIIERVIPLVVNHMVTCQTLSDRAIRRLSVRLGKATIKELCFLIEADHCGRPPLAKKLSDNLIHLIYKATALGIIDGKPEAVVKGQDIVDFGYKPGPIVGKIQKKLYDMQINGKFAVKYDGLSRIKSFVHEF